MKTKIYPATTEFSMLIISFFLIIFVFTSNHSHGQCPGNLLTNTDFSNGLTNWTTFNGFVPPPVNANNGCLNDFVVLRAINFPPQDGDGFEQSVNIVGGNCYDICMCMGLPSGSTGMNDVQIWAATNNAGVTYSSLINNTYPAGSAELIGVLQVNFPVTPQQFCKLGWVASQNYSRIIILNSTLQPTSEVHIDNICFKQTNLCAPCIDANISSFFTQVVTGLTAQFTNLTTSNIGNLQYSWEFNDPANAPNDVSTQQDPVYTFSAPGVYTVCLTATGYADPDSLFLCQDTYCICVQVPGIFPPPSCDTTGNNFSFSVAGNTTMFSGTSSGGFAFNWDFGDPSSGPANSSTLQNPSHVFSAPGFYNVCLIISYPGSMGEVCRDTICKTVHIVSSSVGEIFALQPVFYPNPVRDMMHLTVTLPGEAYIISSNGQIVLREYLQEQQNLIDVSGLTKGIYFLKFEGVQQNAIYQSFIKD